jgi:nitrite reductase (NADH) small subunit
MTEHLGSVRLPPSHEASADHNWVRVATCDQIPPRQGRSVSIAGRELAIFNLGPSTELGPSTRLGAGAEDRFFATDNRCPHKGGPLCDGIVTGVSAVCPLHAWKINLADGRVERPQGAEQCVATYAVRVQDGVVAVDLR